MALLPARRSSPAVNQLDPALDPGHPSLLEISTAEGILSAAQMNVIEFLNELQWKSFLKTSGYRWLGKNWQD